MLPKEVWSIPKYGTFNIHASLLPQYRGAAPINWALINGEKKTGGNTSTEARSTHKHRKNTQKAKKAKNSKRLF